MKITRDDMVSNGTMTYRADGSAHDTADLVSDEQIEALRREASEAGDAAQVAACNKALDGDAEARRECARVIQAARAMGE
mgnify:CR=1 FL=1